MTAAPLQRLHGGPGALGPVRWDFSSNANAAGPCPGALRAVQQADPRRYPDPAYHALCERLAAWHGVARERILVAASASEFVQRLTAAGARLLPGPVAVPAHAYGDYAVAAAASGRAVCHPGDAAHGTASLRWYADPGSPLGQGEPPPPGPGDRPTVLDAAYAPLRLDGQSAWTAGARDAVFQLHSPNKALGLTGVRGAYAVAPLEAACDWPVRDLCAALRTAEPSWPLGAHAVALLGCWTDVSTQAWLHAARRTLRGWAATLGAGLHALGLQPLPSATPFCCALRPAAATPAWLHARGLAVRDTASFGLPGRMRVSAQPPAATAALLAALRAAQSSCTDAFNLHER